MVFDKLMRVILTALRKYGSLVADNRSDWFITGATVSSWGDGGLDSLKTVPGNAFEVIQPGAIIQKDFRVNFEHGSARPNHPDVHSNTALDSYILRATTRVMSSWAVPSAIQLWRF